MGRSALAPILVLALVGGALIVFAAVDRRPLNDHDPEFAGGVAPQALAWPDADLAGRAGLLRDRLLRHGQRHPQLPQASLLVWTGTFGWSRLSIRLHSLPWLLALVLGAWGAARAVTADARLAALSAWLVGTLPLTVQLSRKWFPHFFAAALAALALWAALAAVRRVASKESVPVALWLAFGLAQGARLHAHPVGVPDTALLFGLSAGALAVLRAPRSAWLGLLGAAALAGVLGAPALLGGEETLGFAAYLQLVGRYLGPEGLTRAGELLSPLGRALLPGGALVLGVGLAGLALPGPGGWRSLGLRLLALQVAAQVPLILVTVGNGGFLSDWLLIVPSLGVLVTAGLGRVAERAGAWVLGVSLLPGLVTLLLPLLLARPLTEPLPGAFAGLGRSEHGGRYNSHLVPVTGPQPAATLAGLLEPTERIPVFDLRFGGGCGPDDGGLWLWEPPSDGFSATPGTDPFEEAWGFAPTWERGADLDEEALGDVVLVRLWEVPDACPPSPERRARLVAEARGVATRRLGGEATVLDDPPHWFLAAPRPSSRPEPGYLAASLLVR